MPGMSRGIVNTAVVEFYLHVSLSFPISSLPSSLLRHWTCLILHFANDFYLFICRNISIISGIDMILFIFIFVCVFLALLIGTSQRKSIKKKRLNRLSPSSEPHPISPNNNTTWSNRHVMRITEMTLKMECCDVRTNSLQQYHRECIKNSVEKMHVDIGA